MIGVWLGESHSCWGQDRLTHQCPLPSPMSCLWHNLLVVVHMWTVRSGGSPPLLSFRVVICARWFSKNGNCRAQRSQTELTV